MSWLELPIQQTDMRMVSIFSSNTQQESEYVCLKNVKLFEKQK